MLRGEAKAPGGDRHVERSQASYQLISISSSSCLRRKTGSDNVGTGGSLLHASPDHSGLACPHQPRRQGVVFGFLIGGRDEDETRAGAWTGSRSNGGSLSHGTTSGLWAIPWCVVTAPARVGKALVATSAKLLERKSSPLFNPPRVRYPASPQDKRPDGFLAGPRVSPARYDCPDS